ncbi:MAG: phosphodiester glycosidase family protein [Candidatus Microgenomates bacterium]|jgi:hypothetical protein
MKKTIYLQKGFLQILPILILLAIAILPLVILSPSLKNKIINHFKQVPIAATQTPTPIVSPTEAPVPIPVKTTNPKPTIIGTPKPVAISLAPVTSNQLPATGYESINVVSDVGTFKVDIGAGDVSSTKVVIDTASDSDCSSNCPALPLSTFIQRRSAYAGINGTYFCPAESAYASCGANNSFNFLVMNINKYYFNSDMNVYSTNPGAIFSSSYVRFVGAIQEWGRDTSPDGVISNYPLLVSGGNINFSGSSDPKLTSKTTRSFVANKGNIVYIGDVFSASASDVAHVLHTLGVDNALNLDDAGSAAFWYGGYKVGPGRNIPNAILFINR